jgi:hypothetical protein
MTDPPIRSHPVMPTAFTDDRAAPPANCDGLALEIAST